MEDVLDLYEEEYDPQYPTVCFDEKPIALVADVAPSQAVIPGVPARTDYEYQRNGTCNAFFFVEPQAGWRHVQVTRQRTKREYAHCMQWLVDEAYPDAEYIRVVQDAHACGSLRNLCSVGSAAHLASSGVSLYAHARELVEHGGNRNRHLLSWLLVASCGG